MTKIKDKIKEFQEAVVFSSPDWWYWEGWLDVIERRDLWFFEDGSPELEPERAAYIMGYEDAKGVIDQ